MGLDLRLVKIDDNPDFHARWSYSGFMVFRQRLAAAAGINLDEMIHFGGETPWPDVDDEPLVPLLDHSDCDGDMRYSDCEAVVGRLRSLVDSWPENDYDRIQALKLVAMMEEVAEDRAEMVIFA